MLLILSKARFLGVVLELAESDHLMYYYDFKLLLLQ